MTGREESLISKFTEGTYISLVTVPTISKNHPRTPFSYMGSSWLLDGNRLWLDSSEGVGAVPVGSSEWRVCSPGRVNLEDFLKEMAPDAASPKHLGHWIETQHSRLL